MSEPLLSVACEKAVSGSSSGEASVLSEEAKIVLSFAVPSEKDIPAEAVSEEGISEGGAPSEAISEEGVSEDVPVEKTSAEVISEEGVSEDVPVEDIPAEGEENPDNREESSSGESPPRAEKRSGDSPPNPENRPAILSAGALFPPIAEKRPGRMSL